MKRFCCNYCDEKPNIKCGKIAQVKLRNYSADFPAFICAKNIVNNMAKAEL